MTESTIVRENLMTRENYTPYCGSNSCRYNNPRTKYNKGINQFTCSCGWTSEFPTDFIERYNKKWN